MDIRMADCLRCGQHRETVFVIQFRPGGMSFVQPAEPPPPPKDENVCTDCLTDDELGRMLHPVAAFVINTIPRGSTAITVSLETVAAIFQVRSNEPDAQRNRNAALRAVGFH